jgi:DNA-binding response OmpR family regulator
MKNRFLTTSRALAPEVFSSAMIDGSGLGASRFQFGVFEADLKVGKLRRSGIRVQLQSQPFKVPGTVVEHCGKLDLREALQMEICGSDTSGDDRADSQHGCSMRSP